MSDTRRKIVLIAGGNIEVAGEGDGVRLKLSAHRKKKNGDYEFFEMDIELGRWVVQRLARQIATMHVRDRERLTRETARIEKEIDAIKQPETKT